VFDTIQEYAREALPRSREALPTPDRKRDRVVALAGIATRLGRKALQEIACIAKPDAILAWYRKLVAQKFDGSKKRGLASRPRVDAAIEAPVVKLARENSSRGYDRIVGAVANLGHEISDQSVGNILRRHGMRPRRSANKAQPGASSFTVLLSAHVRWVNRTLHGQRSLHKLRAENHNNRERVGA